MTRRSRKNMTLLILLSTCLVISGVNGLHPSWADDAQDLYNQALMHVQGKNFSQAATTLKQAIQIFPRFAQGHHLLGIVLFNGLEQPQEAIQHLEKAVALHPNFARAYLDLGLVYQHQKNLDKAKQALSKAVEIYPRYPEARLSLALVYDQLHETEQAISAYTATLELQPNQPMALYNLATLFETQGKTSQAQQQLENALKLANGNFQVTAMARERLKDIQEMREMAENM